MRIKVKREMTLHAGPEVSSHSQTVLHGEATVPDRHSRIQEGQRPSPHHHLRPTHRPQVGCSRALVFPHMNAKNPQEYNCSEV